MPINYSWCPSQSDLERRRISMHHCIHRQYCPCCHLYLFHDLWSSGFPSQCIQTVLSQGKTKLYGWKPTRKDAFWWRIGVFFHRVCFYLSPLLLFSYGHNYRFMSNLIATVFMLLNLNSVMTIIFNVPAAISSTVCYSAPSLPAHSLWSSFYYRLLHAVSFADCRISRTKVRKCCAYFQLPVFDHLWIDRPNSNSGAHATGPQLRRGSGTVTRPGQPTGSIRNPHSGSGVHVQMETYTHTEAALVEPTSPSTQTDLAVHFYDEAEMKSDAESYDVEAKAAAL